MRIIRGCYKGKTIYPPKGFKSRPTTDFAKESLFNIIENMYNIEDITVLDLFSGSGNISLEFLSRACKQVTSVEYNRKYCAHIKRVIEDLFPGSSDVICYDAFKFCKNSNLDYDLIFADPPYDHKRIDDIPTLVFANESLKDEALLIVEHPASIDFKGRDNFVETRKYGNVNFSVFRHMK